MPWTKPIYRQRPFLAANYTAESESIPKPPKPRLCPLAEGGAPRPCGIRVHGYRKRKCGPGFSLAVFICKIHSLSFTTYPPGWAPYGRRPLAGEDSTFSAIECLANGTIWPERAVSELPTSKTQRRWYQAWISLLALGPDLLASDRHKASICLGIDTLTLEERANQIRAGPTIKDRALVMLLVPCPGPTNITSLFSRGFDVGYWGHRYQYTKPIG